MYVITVDQVDSRRAEDRVPQALEALEAIGTRRTRPFERTAGDEIQGVTDDPFDVVRIVGVLVRAGDWRIGIGSGPVQQPLPESPRAGRGPAFVAARAAVRDAHPVPGQLAVRLGDTPGLTAALAALRERHTGFAETALLLHARVLRARTDEGWEVTELLTEGLTQRAVAQRLGVTPSAVSQRVRRSGWAEQAGVEALVAHHLSVADGRTDP